MGPEKRSDAGMQYGTPETYTVVIVNSENRVQDKDSYTKKA